MVTKYQLPQVGAKSTIKYIVLRKDTMSQKF